MEYHARRSVPVRRPNFRNSISGILLLLALSFSAVPESEAGLFDKIRANQKARAAQKAREEQAKRTPRPQYRSYYHDAHQDAYINEALLAADDEDADRRIVIDIARQRAFLIIHDLVAIDTAVSTARGGKYTPRGNFQITERVETGKTSTIYHVYMPYWQRLSQTAVGMHVGDLPGYPASAGCIRLPQSVGPILFENTQRGVPVEIVDSWNESGLSIPYSLPSPELFAGA